MASTNNPYDDANDGGAYSAAAGAYEDVPEDVENQYNEGSPGQEPAARPPPPPGPKPMGLQQRGAGGPPVTSEPGYFAKLNLPVTYVTTLSALAVIVFSILNIVLNAPALADVIIDGYLIFFGLCFLVLMLPNIKLRGLGCLTRLRDDVETWARFLSTAWGRGWFSIFICVLAFGADSWTRIVTGIVLVLNGVLSIWCGRLAAAKYNRLREYLVAGKEGDALLNSIQAKAVDAFDQSGLLHEPGLHRLIEQSGRAVTSSEVHAIYAFFDRDHTGQVDIQMFAERLEKNIRLKSL